MKNVWDSHYERDKSKLIYPDENLIRLLSRVTPPNKKALDFGCGSGRHSFLLEREGYSVRACDNSITTINKLQSDKGNINFLHVEKLPYPFSKREFGLIVSWGVFHYNKRSIAKQMRDELMDCLEDRGILLGSIRASTDTHLKIQNGEMALSDLSGGYAETYTQADLEEFLSPFRSFEIGYSERTPLGKLNERICHWFFLAIK